MRKTFITKAELQTTRSPPSVMSFLHPDDKTASGFAVSGDHGTKSSEVYGFAGSITTVVATAVFNLASFHVEIIFCNFLDILNSLFEYCHGIF
ncbi:hypothetical protein OIU84_015788 [Salix udensis]|uniref:Uncharacterized protein n=1 Tax=Salix udensis TaxID=889485 RepID=A0AAD6NNR7_9ROSI|nr:hypothetical protein OIU84_015788 [Salix udensis]